MDLLVKAIRTVLTGDATLIAIVPAVDIVGSYNPELTNYPCLALGISAGGSRLEVSGVLHATLKIEVYSDTNALQIHTVLDRVRDLLHNQAWAITDASRFLHVIYEANVQYDAYDLATDVWRGTATYEILYATSNLTVIATTSGAIYTDSSDVTAVSGKEIASFRGDVTLDISFEREIRYEGERFGKSVYYSKGVVTLTIEEVMFKHAAFNKVWSFTANSSDTLADDSTAATSYAVTQTTVPPYRQVLFQCIKSDDGKKLEIEADRAVCESLAVPFSKEDVAVHNCQWVCLGDSGGDVVKISVEQ